MIHPEALALVAALAAAWLIGWRSTGWPDSSDGRLATGEIDSPAPLGAPAATALPLASRPARVARLPLSDRRLATGGAQPARVARLPLPRGRAAAFFGGLLALTAALNGPLHDLAERSLVSAHMIQHLLLVLVVAPCLLAGTWPAMLDRALSPRGVRVVVAAATQPMVALGIYAAALIAWHLPGPYALTIHSEGWHVVAHISLAGSAVLAWWPVVSPSRRLPALPYGAQILYLFAFGMPMTVVAAMITGADVVLYPTASATPLDDQRLGGILMWVPAGLVPLIAFTIVFFRWNAAEADDPV